MEELWRLDATAQAELVQRGQVKPAELVEAAIARIERLNPALNAVITPMYERALDAANGDLPKGPFTGVPFLLKDVLAEYAGVRHTEACAMLQDFVPQQDSELVARYKRAGLIIVGKTNVPELGMMPTTEPKLFGPASNPWDASRTAGGSSGGSAAAVASGMVAMAHGNDGGGSIRIPASCCGVLGLKPTRGRISLAPHYAELWHGGVVEHALTRSVRDSATLLDATCGPATGDPYWAPPPSRPFTEEARVEPGRLRIGFSTKTATGVPVHPDCVAAVRDAAELCSGLGHEVEEAAPTISMDGQKLNQTFITAYSAWQAKTVDGWARRIGRKPTPDLLEPLTCAVAGLGRSQSASAYLLAIQDLQRVAREIAGFFDRQDLWLTPVLAEPPLPLGSFDAQPDNPLAGLFRAGQFAPFTAMINITGQPAMSVPLFWNAAGLPIGVHFVTRFGDEATLFRLAAQLEAARPWWGRRPPVS